MVASAQKLKAATIAEREQAAATAAALQGLVQLSTEVLRQAHEDRELFRE
jgi:hypothetical protein